MPAGIGTRLGFEQRELIVCCVKDLIFQINKNNDLEKRNVEKGQGVNLLFDGNKFLP